ncbi:MAG TPA: hypothetical protein VF313_00280 [Anaerolineaceae bacterium]
MSRSASLPYLPLRVSSSSTAGVESGSKPNSSNTARIVSITYWRFTIWSGRMSRIPRGTRGSIFWLMVEDLPVAAGSAWAQPA